ncbi:hypothetical protein DCCM_0549 [Desulfocucumis palustris]|uniref:Flagellar hook-length control protein FliK n=1 Tax=Desulfocucumis palustris TaxID=1898651 RepID=A0A2L2X861_9FIRM|nr:hypothetical protein [Desulfocucumis palustris]GBF32355.1 hypothetical protein DCCM_0549 [Desulfocucumis palustris]
MNINWTGINIKTDGGINTYAGLKTSGADLNLQPGQVCQGKVLGQAGEDLYMVRVDGKNTLIQSPYRMETNSTITFQVEGQRDGQYMVRLYHGQEGQDVLIQSILKQMDLKDSPLLRELIKGFVTQELPLKPELLKQAERLAQKLGGNTPENIHIAIMSLKAGITEQPGVMDALRLYLSSLGKMARGSEYQLSVLLEKLGDVPAINGESARNGTGSDVTTAARNSSKPVSLTPEGTNIFNQLRDMLRAVVLKPGEGPETVAAQLKNLISAQLPRISPEEAGPPGETNILNQLRDILQSVARKPGGEPETAAVQLNNPTSGRLAGISPEETGTPEGTKIFNQLRDILQSLALKPGKEPATAEEPGNNTTPQRLAGISPGESRAVFSGIEEIIRQTGIADTPLNRAIVRGLISREIPVKTELPQQAENMVPVQGQNKTENTDTGQAMLQKLPAQESGGNTRAFNSLAPGSGPAAGELALKLSAFLQNLSGLLDSPEEAVPRPDSGNLPEIKLSPEGEELFRRLFDFLQTATRPGNIIPGKPGENADIPAAVKLLTNALANGIPALEGEKGLLSNAPAQNQASGTVNRPGPSAGDGDINPSAQPLPGKEHIPDTASIKSRGFSELLEGFSQLLQEVRKAAREAGNPPQLQSLLQEGAMIERQMAGHQIYQSFVREYNQQNYLYFNIPFVQNGDSENWGQLRIIREGGGGKAIDPENFGVALFLNTDNLGTLLVELKVREKDVTASGRVADDWVAGLLTGAWPRLQEALAGAGYRLHPCRWRVGPVKEDLRPVFTGQPETAYPPLRLQSLDVTI